MRRNHCYTEDGKWHCNVWKCIGWGILGVLGFVVILFVASWVIMTLWNHLIPGIFKLPTIGYWQALGLAVLFRLLFGGCGHGMHKIHRMHYKHHRHGGCGCGCKCCGSESDKECCSDSKNESNVKIDDPMI